MKNPYTPIIISSDTRVEKKEEEEKKIVSGKSHSVRYLVGSSSEERYVDGGSDDIAMVEDKSLHVVSSIHKMEEGTFHFNASRVHTFCSDENGETSQNLTRVDTCADHEIVEVAYQSPGVECCAMSKEEADKYDVPIQYLAGYLLGKSNGKVKIALTKNVLETGETYYDSIYIIPEPIIQTIDCLA